MMTGSPTPTGASFKERARACAYCSKSKTKCLWNGEPGVGSCQRCTRLNRSCVLPIPGERKKRGPSTRVGQLEEKIDGIMSLLNASRELQQQQQQQQLQHTPQSSPDDRSTPSEPVVPSVQAVPSPASTRGPSRPIGSMIYNTPPHETIEIIPNFNITHDEADRLLNLYRTTYSPNFPYVLIPQEVTAGELLANRPFLFRTIIQVVAPQNAVVQCNVSRWFREYIAMHVVVNQEKRLELLQALIVFLAWGDFHYHVGTQGVILIQTAVSLVIDLGLNRPSSMPRHVPNHMIDEALRLKGIRNAPPHTLEDMRAFLGCFLLASTIAILCRRLYLFPYTAYVTNCCDALAEEDEYDSDRFLVAQIRMQRCLCRSFSAFPNPHLDNSGPAEFNMPLYMAQAAIRTEFETIRREAPLDVQHNSLFHVIYCGLLIRLYEPTIYTRCVPAFNESSSEGSHRTEALWACLDASRMFHESLLSLPASILAHSPLPVYTLYVFHVITMTRLLFLDDADWDVKSVRNTFDLSEAMLRLSDRFDDADRLSMDEEWVRKRKFLDEVRATMAFHRDKCRWISSWYQEMTGTGPADDPNTATASQADVDQVSGMLLPSGFDDVFWQAFLDIGGRIDGMGSTMRPLPYESA